MKFSLKMKVVVFTVAVIAVISCIAVVLFDSKLAELSEGQYTTQSIDLAKTVALSVDADEVARVKEAVSAIYDRTDDKVTSDDWDTPEYDDYIARFSSVENMDAYQLLLDDLRRIQDVNHVLGLYIVYLDVPTESLVYLADASPENVCLPGNADRLVGEDLALLDDPDAGFDPSVTNTEEYGWNIATAKPIYDGNGDILAYAYVDISMNEVVAQRQHIITTIVIYLLVLAAIVGVVASLMAGWVIVRPINKLSEASLRYRSSNEGEGDEAFREFDDLDIHTGDEIENLAESMKAMESEIRTYSRRMNEMALTDSLTGVGNRRAYDAEIERVEVEISEGNTEVGLVLADLNGLKRLNDVYGHDRGDVALQKLCAIISQVFEHSPVFRIGGDEFAVVLEGHDYQNANALLKELDGILQAEENDESLSPWERISAAAGISFFDSGKDEDMGPVFIRVDEAMYERKRETKAARD